MMANSCREKKLVHKRFLGTGQISTERSSLFFLFYCGNRFGKTFFLWGGGGSWATYAENIAIFFNAMQSEK